MKLTCYGPRGSLASPSYNEFSTLKYGGNTTAYRVSAGDFEIMLDCGTGARVMGNQYMKEGKGFGKNFIVLFSHWHWDHIAGVGFFVPFFINTNKFHIHGHQPMSTRKDHMVETVETLLSAQQATPYFPVAHAALPSTRIYHTHQAQFSESFWYFLDEKNEYVFVPEKVLNLTKETLSPSIKMDIKRWVKITSIPINHPDGALGWRIDYMGSSFTFVTDHEPQRHTNAAINKLAKGSDLILLDGQYTEDQLSGMCQGFGHGSPRSCIEQAASAECKSVWIHHHDPGHNDEKLEEMEKDALCYAEQVGYSGKVLFAREGTTIELS